MEKPVTSIDTLAGHSSQTEGTPMVYHVNYSLLKDIKYQFWIRDENKGQFPIVGWFSHVDYSPGEHSYFLILNTKGNILRVRSDRYIGVRYVS